MGADDRIERAGELYARAVYGGDADGLAEAERGLDAVEADLALARGKVLHARFQATGESAAELPLFERALELYVRLGDPRGEGEALFWIGCLHQYIRRDDALAILDEADAIARAHGARAVARHLDEARSRI